MIANAVNKELAFVDDDALRRMISGCRAAAPDATDEEIAEFAGFQASRIARMRNLENPVSLLIVQLPRCFKGESLAAYRRGKAERERRLRELYAKEGLDYDGTW